MSFLMRFLGGGSRPGETRRDEAETDTVRRIAARLERLDAGTARQLAAFAYVLARVAHADLNISETETGAMQEILRETAHLAEEEAALAVEIAKSQARLLGGTENYVVTREYRRLSSREERERLMRSLYAVAAADGSISGAESAEIARIGEELGFLREELLGIRSEFRDRLSERQKPPAG